MSNIKNRRQQSDGSKRWRTRKLGTSDHPNNHPKKIIRKKYQTHFFRETVVGTDSI